MAALVEFSIVALLLTTMIFGAVELSPAWTATLVLDQADLQSTSGRARRPRR